MFKLRKLHPPFGTQESPITEASYSEGEVRVVDGLCDVRLPETRDRLLKMGYQDEVSAEGPHPPPQRPPKPSPKRGRR